MDKINAFRSILKEIATLHGVEKVKNLLISIRILKEIATKAFSDESICMGFTTAGCGLDMKSSFILLDKKNRWYSNLSYAIY